MRKTQSLGFPFQSTKLTQCKSYFYSVEVTKKVCSRSFFFYIEMNCDHVVHDTKEVFDIVFKHYNNNLIYHIPLPIWEIIGHFIEPHVLNRTKKKELMWYSFNDHSPFERMAYSRQISIYPEIVKCLSLLLRNVKTWLTHVDREWFHSKNLVLGFEALSPDVITKEIVTRMEHYLETVVPCLTILMHNDIVFEKLRDIIFVDIMDNTDKPPHNTPIMSWLFWTNYLKCLSRQKPDFFKFVPYDELFIPLPNRIIFDICDIFQTADFFIPICENRHTYMSDIERATLLLANTTHEISDKDVKVLFVKLQTM